MVLRGWQDSEHQKSVERHSRLGEQLEPKQESKTQGPVGWATWIEEKDMEICSNSRSFLCAEAGPGQVLGT